MLALLGLATALVLPNGGLLRMQACPMAQTMKQTKDASEEEERPPLINVGTLADARQVKSWTPHDWCCVVAACSGSICEFHDPKHGNGQADPVLGVVQTCEHKAKGRREQVGP